MSISFCSLSRRLCVNNNRSRLLTYNKFILNPNILPQRQISYLKCLHSNNKSDSNLIANNSHKFRTFCSNSSGENNNNNGNNNDSNSNNKPDSLNVTNLNNRIYLEAKNQKSLVRATGKNKSLVPYIGSALVIPIQKPLFPGFSSMLYLKDENLKTYFINQFKKRLEVEHKSDNKIENTEWIGLFLSNPKQPTSNTIEEDLKNDSESSQMSINNESNDDTTNDESKIVWHPALDEVNSDMHHFVEILPGSMDDIFEYGVLAKIDYNDETTNINEFIKLELNNNTTMNNSNNNNNNKKKKSKSIAFPVNRWEDPLVLKVISARRIKLDSICEHKPLLTGNIQHLQPNININDMNIKISNEEDEIKCRSAFNVASDLLRRLYSDDPDNRRDMIQLWSARHHIDIGFFCDFAASITNSTPRELQKLLECIDYGERLELLCQLLKREEFMIKKRDEIMNNVDALIKKEDENQYLRMILHTTQKRLMINHKERNILAYGNGMVTNQNGNNNNTNNNTNNNNNTHTNDIEMEEKKDRYQRLAQKFKDRVCNKTMCSEAKDVFDEGIEKLLSAKNKESLDIETTKQYLDWISSLPWDNYSTDNDNIICARNILDETHYSMKSVKQSILEYIAVNILHGNNNNNNNKNILCLIGPPGVGKTSIGVSIAKALNKEYFKFSLGGSDDSHLLKGFLRTYAGSQPGKIIYGLKQCGTSNPLILIDEIDKMGARHSDPSHALLEILDPSQNESFSDNYLDFPVDLSKILFVCTANDESKINPILKDRLQIIHLNGYDEHEKLEIAKKYLIQNALKKCGLKKENISMTDDVIIELIKYYSRESGVRSLAQNIEKICYKSALQLVEAGITAKDINKNINEMEMEIEMDENKKNETGKCGTILEKFSTFVKRIGNNEEENERENERENQEIPFIDINKDNLKEYVGLKKYCNERTYVDDKSMPFGVVTGLAYTTNGGCITYVETTKYIKYTNENNTLTGGSIKATGQLGKVMNESVEIAQCLSRAILFNINPNNRFFDEFSIHLHCPEGSVAKDGPSAGITMVTALLSLALNQKISPNIAMTGEITLTGKILKIGGLKEKLLAAKRSKITTLILPFDNFDDFYDNEFGIPKYLRDEFKDVHFVKHYDEVLQILFNQHLPVINNNTTNAYTHDNNNDNKFQMHLNTSLEMPKPYD